METNALIQYPHTAKVLERYGREFIERYKANLIASGRPASGDLIKSLDFRVQIDEQVFAVDVSLLEYWKYIENGTAPHWPPVDAIARWVEVKPVIPYPMKDGRLPSTNQLAYLIGRKIARFGTEGSPDFRNANEQLLADMQESIVQAVTEDLTEQVDIIFTQFRAR